MLAMQPVAVPETLRAKVSSPTSGALLVVHVETSSPAEKSGIQLGDLVVEQADLTVWLAPPLRVPVRRLWRRTHGRIRDNVQLWGGNRESWRGAFLGWDSLFVYALRSWFRHKRQWPRRFSGDPRLVRLRSPDEARRWLERR